MSAPWAHLVGRFVGSLWPLGPPAADDAWAREQLLPGEAGLWARMSNADRRHAVGVARRARASLGEAATRSVLAAALLHDVGKIEAGMGPVRRSLATVAGMALGHGKVQAWLPPADGQRRVATGGAEPARRRRRGWRGRTAQYLCHDALGAELLAAAGSDELTVRWAREHHLPPESWTVPADIGTALKAADDD